MAGSAPIVDGVLLAGGRSTRMGRDKARLPHPVSGHPLVAHQLALLREATGRTPLLAVRADADYPEISADTPRVFDDGARGPLAALHGALAACCAPFALVIAVDMPGVDVVALRRLLAACSEGVGAVASGPRGAEPLFAVYPREAALAAAAASLAAGRLALHGIVHEGLRAGWLLEINDLPSRCLENWNTPDSLTPP